MPWQLYKTYIIYTFAFGLLQMKDYDQMPEALSYGNSLKRFSD